MTEQQLSSEKQTVIPTPPKDTKCVNIHLLQSTSQLHNLKWFGLAIEGRLSIKELMETGHIPTIYEKAALLGIADQLPMILSNSSAPEAYCIYFEKFPANLSSQEELTPWVQSLCRNLEGYVENKIGVYIPPQLNDYLAKELNFFNFLMKNIITAYPTCTYSFYPGRYTMNEILNQALELKKSLIEENIHVTVYH